MAIDFINDLLMTPLGEQWRAVRMAQRTRDYLSRGWRYSNRTDEEMAALYVAGVRALALDPEHPSLLEFVGDVRSEYDMRAARPPIEAVEAEFRAIMAHHRRMWAEMGEDQRAAIIGGMVADAGNVAVQ